jgi:hypothetical protein
MPADQPGKSFIGAKIPTNLKDALYKLAKHRDSPYDEVNMTDLIEASVREYLARQDDLPEEVRDDLDADLLANAGGEADA